MKTYFVHHEGEEYFNCDLFVMAESPEQAHGIWKEHCHVNAWQVEKNSHVRVWRVDSAKDTVGAIDWSDMSCFMFAT